MKPRKDGESAEAYIARLEAANAELRKNNAAHSKFHGYCVEVLRVAGSRLGLLLDYAAEICDMQGDQEYLRIKEELDRLAGLPWDRDPQPFDLPKRIDWRVENPDPPSDAGMILKSALEKAKAARAPWDDKSDLFPELPPIEKWDWQTIEMEVFDALMDFDASRGLLRDDLRSAMYDYCFERVGRAVRNAYALQEEERGVDRTERCAEEIPF